MLTYRYPIIAREGWWLLALVAAIAGEITWRFGYAGLIAWIPVIFLLFLFRDPARKVPAVPLGIVSPVDGRITAIEPVYDGYVARDAICIRIRMGFTDVYSVHSAVEGKVIKQWLRGPRLIGENKHQVFTSGKSFAQWIQTDEADDVVMVIDAKSRISRPRCYVHSGERVGQGQRCGFIPFGIQVELLLPTNARIAANVGDVVSAGEKVLATFVRT
jgi:phosphatidylserine decarboxylase